MMTRIRKSTRSIAYAVMEPIMTAPVMEKTRMKAALSNA